ncbi:putative UDP-glucose 4-epimerase [Flagelloscypha sp. PMI_526]|nr:putative UDP-glucose 4-epimerase [Flagelloscypha sp. PMI_526]
MKVFVTGASGFIGSNIGSLASDKSAEKVTTLGAYTHSWHPTPDLDVLRQASSDADAIIHTAFNHEVFTQPNGYIQAPSSTPPSALFPRLWWRATPIVGFEESTCDSPLSFTGQGKEHMFISGQVGIAKKSGFDAATLYVLALTSDKVKAGSNLHAVANEGVPTKEIAEFIAKKTGLETKSVPPAEAMGHWGFLGMVLSIGGKTTTKLTQEWTGWEPKQQGLFEELESYTF